MSVYFRYFDTKCHELAACSIIQQSAGKLDIETSIAPIRFIKYVKHNSILRNEYNYPLSNCNNNQFVITLDIRPNFKTICEQNKFQWFESISNAFDVLFMQKL